jgi:hypothetical protein
MRVGSLCVTIRRMATRRGEKAVAPVSEEPPAVEGVQFLEPDGWRAMLEEVAQRDFGMSLSEFERAYRAGELDSCESRVAALAVLLPEPAR